MNTTPREIPLAIAAAFETFTTSPK